MQIDLWMWNFRTVVLSIIWEYDEESRFQTSAWGIPVHRMHSTEELLAPHASKIQPSLGWDTASILTARSQIAPLSDRK